MNGLVRVSGFCDSGGYIRRIVVCRLCRKRLRILPPVRPSIVDARPSMGAASGVSKPAAARSLVLVGAFSDMRAPTEIQVSKAAYFYRRNFYI